MLDSETAHEKWITPECIRRFLQHWAFTSHMADFRGERKVVKSIYWFKRKTRSAVRRDAWLYGVVPLFNRAAAPRQMSPFSYDAQRANWAHATQTDGQANEKRRHYEEINLSDKTCGSPENSQDSCGKSRHTTVSASLEEPLSPEDADFLPCSSGVVTLTAGDWKTLWLWR